jgi:hypothetical protein
MDPITKICQPTSLSNCDICNRTVCIQCTKGYGFDISGGTCSVCSQNYTLFNGICTEKSSRCITTNSANPAICETCSGLYTGP